MEGIRLELNRFDYGIFFTVKIPRAVAGVWLLQDMRTAYAGVT